MTFLYIEYPTVAYTNFEILEYWLTQRIIIVTQILKDIKFEFYIFFMLPMFISVNYFTMSELVKYELVTNSHHVLAMVGDND